MARRERRPQARYARRRPIDDLLGPQRTFTPKVGIEPTKRFEASPTPRSTSMPRVRTAPTQRGGRATPRMRTDTRRFGEDGRGIGIEPRKFKEISLPSEKKKKKKKKLSPVDEVLGVDEAPVSEENPWVNPFMEVYEKTKVGAMENLEEMQKSMAERFAHRGGYFGGKHAVAQGEMAAETGTALDQLLAQTELGASEKQYEDWKRARGETMGLMNLIPTLLGTESFQNIVQPGQEKGGGLGSLAGGAAGSVLGPMGGAVGSGIGEKIVGGKGN